MERGDKLNDLAERSDRLTSQAQSFERSSLRLKRRVRWEQARRWILIIVGVVVVVAALTLASCGVDLKRCRG
jgi:hypothetical protein